MEEKTLTKRLIFSINNNNATTLFSHKEISIPTKYTGDYSISKPGLGYYKFSVDNELIELAPNEYIKRALQDINSMPELSVIRIEGHGNPFVKTGEYDQYLFKISEYLEKKMEIIFWISYANWKQNMGIEAESFEIETTCVYAMDGSKIKVIDATALMIGIDWRYPTDDPFCNMAIKSAYYCGANMIAAAGQYMIGEESLDFYQINEPATCTSWKSLSELEDEEEQENVIYMLYDENRMHLYVGRADRLKERLLQHREKVDDPIPEFTHYRFSKLQDIYYKYSYLIEDAAIHDIGWIFKMSKSSHFHCSLQEEIEKKRIKGDLSKIKVVNRVECQPQIINKVLM